MVFLPSRKHSGPRLQTAMPKTHVWYDFLGYSLVTAADANISGSDTERIYTVLGTSNHQRRRGIFEILNADRVAPGQT